MDFVWRTEGSTCHTLCKLQADKLVLISSIGADQTPAVIGNQYSVISIQHPESRIQYLASRIQDRKFFTHVNHQQKKLHAYIYLVPTIQHG